MCNSDILRCLASCRARSSRPLGLLRVRRHLSARTLRFLPSRRPSTRAARPRRPRAWSRSTGCTRRTTTRRRLFASSCRASPVRARRLTCAGSLPPCAQLACAWPASTRAASVGIPSRPTSSILPGMIEAAVNSVRSPHALPRAARDRLAPRLPRA